MVDGDSPEGQCLQRPVGSSRLEKIEGKKALKVTLEADSWLIELLAPSTDFWIDT